LSEFFDQRDFVGGSQRDCHLRRKVKIAVGRGAPGCLGAEQDSQAHATVLAQGLPEEIRQIGLGAHAHGRIMG